MASQIADLHAAITGISPRAVQRVLDQYDPLTWTMQTARITLPKAAQSGLDARISFDQHPFMPGIYRDTHPHIVNLKGAQLGFSTWVIIRNLWALTTWPMNTIYTIGGTDIGAHVQARINPIIAASEYLSDRLLDVDSVHMKRFAMRPKSEIPSHSRRGRAATIRYFMAAGLSTAYFSGAATQREAISRDADYLIHDEVDKSDQEVIDLFRSRIQGPSIFKWTTKLSTPTIPGWGIDREFRLTDMRHWLIKCPGCNEFSEMTFPDSLQPQTWEEHLMMGHPTVREGEACPDCHYICLHCKRRWSDEDRRAGTWVPQVVDTHLAHGYSVSQMAALYKPASDILRSRAEAIWPASFWNNVMGVPWDEGASAFTEQSIIGIPGIDTGRTDPTREMAVASTSPTMMGVDIGNHLDWCIDQIDPGGRPRTIAFGRIPVQSEADSNLAWAELDRMMERFNVVTCVMDAMPEMTMARSFRARWNRPGATPRVYLSFYGNREMSETAKFDTDAGVVYSPRDRALSETAEELLTRKVLPKYEPGSLLWKAYIAHHVNSKRIAVLQKGLEREGIVESYQWVNVGPDHQFHAANYARLARVAPRGAIPPTVGLVTLNRTEIARRKLAQTKGALPPPQNRRRG